MCLLVDSDKLRSFIIGCPHEFYVYKIAQKISNNFYSPFQGTKIELKEYLRVNTDPNFRIRSFPYVSSERTGLILEDGAIHCCTSLENAKSYKSFFKQKNGNYCILKCVAFRYDIIAIGYFDSVGYPESIALNKIRPIEEICPL